MPLDWRQVLESRASTAAYAGGSAPCRQLQQPARAGGSTGQRRRWCRPSAVTVCGRSRADLEPAEQPPLTNSEPPTEPQNRSQEPPGKEAANHAIQTFQKVTYTLGITRSLSHCHCPNSTADTSRRARDSTPNENRSFRSQTKKENRERRPVNLNLISVTPPLRETTASKTYLSLFTSSRLNKEGRRVVLTRERRFNESLFNGASCLFIIKSGAVFAVLSPRVPLARLQLKTIVYGIIAHMGQFIL